MPIGVSLTDLPEIAVGASDAARIGRGQSVLIRGRDAPVMAGWRTPPPPAAPSPSARSREGQFHPTRVFRAG